MQGAFALVLLTADELLAARDPRGACPLCIGELPDGGYAFASESCALDGGGLPFLRDVAPGELVAAGDGGLETLLPPSDRGRALCALELLAAARADSVLDGVAAVSYTHLDLESGKYGFSALTLMFFLSVMEEKEVQKLLREFRRIVDEENEKSEG